MLFSSAILPAHNAMLHILRLRLTYLSGACSITFRFVHPFAGKAAYCLSHRPSWLCHWQNSYHVSAQRVQYTITTQYTLYRYMIFPAKHFSGRDAVTEQKPYSPVSLRYMPHISTLQVVYDVIFLDIMSSALCRCSGMAAMAGSISGASCAWYRVPIPPATYAPCIIHRTSFYLFWGQPCRGIWYVQPWIVPLITPVRTICPAAPGEFLLLGFTTSGGMFFMA